MSHSTLILHKTLCASNYIYPMGTYMMSHRSHRDAVPLRHRSCLQLCSGPGRGHTAHAIVQDVLFWARPPSCREVCEIHPCTRHRTHLCCNLRAVSWRSRFQQVYGRCSLQFATMGKVCSCEIWQPGEDVFMSQTCAPRYGWQSMAVSKHITGTWPSV